MSIPRDHHYLPQFYLERWASGGEVVRYVRPRGAAHPVDCRRKPPSAIAYERDLYRLADVDDARDSQALELTLFQLIDDRAAKAIQKIENGEQGTGQDRVALSQFMVSLLHRSPARLAAIREELAKQIDGAPYADLEGEEYRNVLKATANRLLARLVESADAASIVSKFKTFKIDVSGSSKKLMTSDRPITLSALLVSPDAFMVMPYAPHRLLILAHREEIVRSFSTQDPDVLVNGINRAVVEQSVDVVIAADTHAKRMVENLFLRPQPDHELDSIGLIRRKAPFIDTRPKVRAPHSRKRRSDMLYLGR